MSSSHHKENKRERSRSKSREIKKLRGKSTSPPPTHHRFPKRKTKNKDLQENEKRKEKKIDYIKAKTDYKSDEEHHHNQHHHRRPHRNRSRSRSPKRQERRKTKKEEALWGLDYKHKNIKEELDKKEKEEKVEKEKPNFETSGKLTEDTNTYKGVVIKYNEPVEARVPKKRWRLYPFKGEQSFPIMHLHRQSAYLIGKDRRIADIPVDHPSCSKQHAVFQFRVTPYTKTNGETGKRVRPYIIDLESTNGTFVNNEKIESRRYIELLEQDVLMFGFSRREYVVLHDKTDTSLVEEEDEVEEEE